MSKHKLIAIVMVPILMLGGYFAAGYFATEPAAMIVMKAQGKCSLNQQGCQLQAKNLVVDISAQGVITKGDSIELEVKTNQVVNDVLTSIDSSAEISQPIRLQYKGENLWRGNVLISEENKDRPLQLRLLVEWQGTKYLADEMIN